MKFWEFNAAFRWSAISLDTLLHSKEWMSPFGEYIDRYHELVQAQDRNVLDMPVPFELSHAAAVLCDDLIFTIDNRGNIRQQQPSDVSGTEISAAYIHDHFGGAIIEDVLEKGSYRVPEALWKQQAEQKWVLTNKLPVLSRSRSENMMRHLTHGTALSVACGRPYSLCLE